MKKKMSFLLLVLAQIGCSVVAAESDSVDSPKLPPGAVLLCGEHVNGGASGRRMHIIWKAYGLNDGTEETRQFYQVQFGQPPAQAEDQRYIWSFKGEQNELRYSINLPSAAGPWSECPIPPGQFKTIVLISNGIWPKDR